MTKTVGSLALHDTEHALNAGDDVLDVTPVFVSMLLAVRYSWGNASRRYDSANGFFKEASWAKLASEKLRKPGTEFVVDEVPALRLDGANGSFVLVSFNTRNPFDNWAEAGRETLRIGTRMGAVVRLLCRLDHASRAEARGVGVLDVARGIPLLPVGSVPPRSWVSWPGKPIQSWSLKSEPDFVSSGVRKVAEVFAEQSGARPLAAARKRLTELGTSKPDSRRDVQIVPR